MGVVEIKFKLGDNLHFDNNEVLSLIDIKDGQYWFKCIGGPQDDQIIKLSAYKTDEYADSVQIKSTNVEFNF